MKKKVYIAGKITGYDDYKVTFEAAKKHFEDLGYVVLNPAELPGGMSPGDYMRVCFAMIDIADIIYFMPNYVDSSGAQVELGYADYIGKDVRFTLWYKNEVSYGY